MSADNQQERPNYRFEYQARMLEDGRVYNSFALNFDFFAKNDKQAIEITRRRISDLEKTSIVDEDGNGNQYFPNALFTLKESGKELKVGRTINFR